MVLQASSSDAALLSKRARPRRDPAARWVQPSTAIQPIQQQPGTSIISGLNPTAAFARFVSEALLCDAAEALELAVRMAPALVPGVQWAHFLAMSEGLSESDPMILTLACSSGGSTMPEPLVLPVTEGLVGYVARSGVPAVEIDASLHVSYHYDHEAAILGRSPVICLPVGATPLSRPNTAARAASREQAVVSAEASVRATNGASLPQPDQPPPPPSPGGTSFFPSVYENPSPDGSSHAATGGAATTTTEFGAFRSQFDKQDAPPTPDAPPSSRVPTGNIKGARVGVSVPDEPVDNLAGVLVFSGRFGTRFGEAELQIARAIVDVVRARIAPMAGGGQGGAIAEGSPGGERGSPWQDDVGEVTTSPQGKMPTPPSTAASSVQFAPGSRQPSRGGSRRGRRATREQLETAAQSAKEELEVLRVSSGTEVDALNAQLDEVAGQLASAEGEREALRAQVRSTQATHAALLADHNQLVAQHRRAEAQIHLLESDVDALRANEMRLLPDLQRWLALTEQLASMLHSAKDIAAGLSKRLPELADALAPTAQELAAIAEAEEAAAAERRAAAIAAGDVAGLDGVDAAAGSYMTVGEKVLWAKKELVPLLSKFDEVLESALPNLVVAKPWLTDLLKPLQVCVALYTHPHNHPSHPSHHRLSLSLLYVHRARFTRS